MRGEAIEAKKYNEAKLCDLWASVSVRYGLRVTVLPYDFYKLAAKDPAYGKFVIPTPEESSSVPFANKLVESMEKLDSLFTTQIMNAVAIPGAQNATMCAGSSNKGDAAGKK